MVRKILFAAIVLIVIVLTVIVDSTIRRGISARTPPTATETMIARMMRHWAVPASARNLRNPIPLTAGVLREGRDHFADHCATCHANDGSGDTEMGPNLYPRVPNMRKSETQNLTDGELFYIIKNGVRLTAMPAWGTERDDPDNWKLVHFIRHLPKITPAELEEMKKMNPMSPQEMEQERQDEEFLKGNDQKTHSRDCSGSRDSAGRAGAQRRPGHSRNDPAL